MAPTQYPTPAWYSNPDAAVCVPRPAVFPGYTCPANSYISGTDWPIVDFAACTCHWGMIRDDAAGGCESLTADPDSVTEPTAIQKEIASLPEVEVETQFPAMTCDQFFMQAHDITESIKKTTGARFVAILRSSCEAPTGYRRLVRVEDDTVGVTFTAAAYGGTATSAEVRKGFGQQFGTAAVTVEGEGAGGATPSSSASWIGIVAGVCGVALVGVGAAVKVRNVRAVQAGASANADVFKVSSDALPELSTGNPLYSDQNVVAANVVIDEDSMVL